jgi:hypothetical protein
VRGHDELNSDPADPVPVPRAPRRWGRGLAIGLLAVVGLCAIGGGITGLVAEHDRKPTAAQVTAATQLYFAREWRTMTAGQIFPATVSYISTLGPLENATRVGIAPAAPCARAFDPGVARALDQAGCVTVLRATYTDPSSTAVTSVGLVVMRTPAAATRAFGATSTGKLGALLPASFPGTIAARFTAVAREMSSEEKVGGPYLLFVTAGYADGRAARPDVDGGYGETVTTDLSTGLSNAVTNTFAAPADSCANRDIKC